MNRPLGIESHFLVYTYVLVLVRNEFVLEYELKGGYKLIAMVLNANQTSHYYYVVLVGCLRVCNHKVPMDLVVVAVVDAHLIFDNLLMGHSNI